MGSIAPPGGPALTLRLSLSLIGGLVVVTLLGTVEARTRDHAFRVIRARSAMGTVLEIDAFGADRISTEAAVTAAFQAVDEVERRLSNWRADSELSRANAATGRPFSLSPATWRSLSAALSLARETDGAFDPTVGAITEALGLTGREPDPRRARPEAVGWQKARLDARARTLFFATAGGSIDSGGFAKGEALDRALLELHRHGVGAARLNFGGQISLAGTTTAVARREDLGEVSIAEPRPGSARELCRFSPGDGSVSTSGLSEHPGHIVDPRTGTAVPFAGSVTVVADTGTRADALSTALFVLGPTAGIAFADRRGITAVFVVPLSGGGWDLLPSREFPRLRRHF
jgi:thiamine biosynthesis lipoprotein